MIDTLELNKSQVKYLNLFNYILKKAKKVKYPKVVKISLTDVLEKMGDNKENLVEGLFLLLGFNVTFEVKFCSKTKIHGGCKLFDSFNLNFEDNLLEVSVNQTSKMLLPNFKFTVKED